VYSEPLQDRGHTANPLFTGNRKQTLKHCFNRRASRLDSDGRPRCECRKVRYVGKKTKPVDWVIRWVLHRCVLSELTVQPFRDTGTSSRINLTRFRCSYFAFCASATSRTPPSRWSRFRSADSESPYKQQQQLYLHCDRDVTVVSAGRRNDTLEYVRTINEVLRTFLFFKRDHFSRPRTKVSSRIFVSHAYNIHIENVLVFSDIYWRSYRFLFYYYN